MSPCRSASRAKLALPRRQVQAGKELADVGPGLALQQIEQLALGVVVQPGVPGQGAEDADMAKVDVHIADADQRQHVEHQAHDLDVALRPGVAEQLGADLQRVARGVQRRRGDVQRTAEIAQPRRRVGTAITGVNARGLGRHVGTDGERAAGERVIDLEGLRMQVTANAGEQGIGIFDQRRDHQLVAPAGEQVEQLSTQLLECAGLRRQQILDALRE